MIVWWDVWGVWTIALIMPRSWGVGSNKINDLIIIEVFLVFKYI